MPTLCPTLRRVWKSTEMRPAIPFPAGALRQQAEKKLKDQLQPAPVRPAEAEIAAFVARFGTPAQK